MDLEAIVWLVFIVIWLVGGLVKQFARLAANRPGQGPRPEVDTDTAPWQSEPAPEPLHQRGARAPAVPPPPPASAGDARPDMPPLLGELMKQLGVEVEPAPSRPSQDQVFGDQATPSEHRHTPGWHERTASEHERKPGWRSWTASEQQRTASEHEATASEQRRTASEHRLTPSEHTATEARPRRQEPLVGAVWGARRAVRRHPIVGALHDRDSLIRAFLAHEILGPPRAMRQGHDDDHG